MKQKARKQDQPTEAERLAVSRLLSAVPQRNASATVEKTDRGALVAVPLRRPRWLVPPISWVLPFSANRRVQLDLLGAEVLGLCDGRRTVEEVIETFAREHKLSFREGQVAVTQFLRALLQRGIVALVGL